MQEKRKILFITEAKLGDSLVLTPALKALKEQLPEPEITVLLLHRRIKNKSGSSGIWESDYSGIAEVFLNNHSVDTVLEADRGALKKLKYFKRLKAELRCIGFLRKRKYDAAVCTFPQSRFLIWSFLAGIKIRIGQKKQDFGFLLTHKPDINRKDNGVLKYFCKLIKPLGAECAQTGTIFHVTEESKNAAQEKINKFSADSSKKTVMLHPGAGEKDRQYPPEKLSELVKIIVKYNAYNFIICYNKYDTGYINMLQNLYGTKLNCIVSDTVSETAALMQLCGVVVANNAGPRHLAAAAGVKTAAVLQKHDEVMWKIYDDEKTHAVIQPGMNCSVCSKNKCSGSIKDGNEYGSSCLYDIEPERVYSVIETMLNNH